MFSQARHISIINLHTAHRSHKLWKLLLAMSPTRNCSNASFTSSPEISAPRALPSGDGTWQGDGSRALCHPLLSQTAAGNTNTRDIQG